MSGLQKHVQKTLVVIGRKGDGKSSTGNTILGRACFTPGSTSKYNPTTCIMQTTHDIPGYSEVNVIDTPGLFNTDVSMEQVEAELARIFEIAPDGVDAFLLVLRIGRFTQELQNTVKYFREIFGKNVMKHTIVIFAGLDDLEFDGDKFESYLKQLPKEVMKLLPEGHTCFNNRSRNADEKQRQTLQLLEKISQLQSRYTKKDFGTKSHGRSHCHAETTPSQQKDEEQSLAEILASDINMDSSKKQGSTSPTQDFNSSTLSTPSRRYVKKEDVIQQLRVAVIGPDSDDFVDKLVRTFPKFTSEDKSSSGDDDPCASYLGKVSGQLVLFVDVGGLESESNSLPRKQVIQSLLSRVSGGLHMVILNIRAGTKEDNVKELIHRFTCLFGPDVMKYSLIAFSDSSLLSRYNRDVITYSRNLPDDTRGMLRIPIGKEAVWAFDRKDSREAFAIEVEQLTSLVDALAKRRPKVERCFKVEMIPNILDFDDDEIGSDSDEEGDLKEMRRNTFGEILTRPLRRARDICVIA